MKRCYVFAAVLLLLSGCGYTKEDLTEHEKMEQLILDLNQQNEDLDAFICTSCGNVAVVCVCHDQYKFPEDMCCECARKNYKICSICGKAEAVDEIQKMDHDMQICSECIEERSNGEPFFYNGQFWQIGEAMPYDYNGEG